MRELRELRTTSWAFRKLLSYRTYRLRTRGREARRFELSRVKKNTAYLQIGLGALVFDGKDPIRVLEFLARFFQQAEALSMAEAEAFVTLPNFLREDALEQFPATRSGPSNSDGIYSWPTAAQFLIRSYGTDENIGAALKSLQNVTQKGGEMEAEYALHLQRAHARCGYCLPPRELISRSTGLQGPPKRTGRT